MNERHVCVSCLVGLPMTYFWTAEHNPMADGFNCLLEEHISGLKGEEIPFVETVEDIEPYVHAAALLFYLDGYKKVPQRLKYMADIAEGRYFAGMLGKRLASSALFSDVDIVIPVPLHWRRRWKRGYNQAEVIANEISLALGAMTDSRVLRRCRHTKTQTKLSVEEKAINVTGAFVASNKQLAEAVKAAAERRKRALHTSTRGFGGEGFNNCPEELGIDGMKVKCHMLLVDDVYTTGSTAFACWRALRSGLAALGLTASAVRISVATLAYVGKP